MGLFWFLVGYIDFLQKNLKPLWWPTCCWVLKNPKNIIVYSAAVWNRFLWVIVIQDVVQASGCTVSLTKQVLELIERAGCRTRVPERDTPRSSNLSEEYNYCYTSMQIGLFINMSDLLAECALKKSLRVAALLNILCLIPFKSSIWTHNNLDVLSIVMAFPNVCNYASFSCISISVWDLSLELTRRAHVLASVLAHTWLQGLNLPAMG